MMCLLMNLFGKLLVGNQPTVPTTMIKSKQEMFINVEMNDSHNNGIPQPRKVAVWAEGTHIEAKDIVIPKQSADSSDDIPTIPDLDDFQDIIEKEISQPPVTGRTDSETVNTLAEVGGGLTATEGMDAALELLKSHIPQVELDNADMVWSVDSLLAQLADESDNN